MIPYAIRWFDSAAESKERTVCSATEEFEMLCWTMIYDNNKLKGQHPCIERIEILIFPSLKDLSEREKERKGRQD